MPEISCVLAPLSCFVASIQVATARATGPVAFASITRRPGRPLSIADFARWSFASSMTIVAS